MPPPSLLDPLVLKLFPARLQVWVGKEPPVEKKLSAGNCHGVRFGSRDEEKAEKNKKKQFAHEGFSHREGIRQADAWSTFRFSDFTIGSRATDAKERKG